MRLFITKKCLKCLCYLLIFVSISVIGSAQQSAFYNSEGQLMFDSTYVIEASRLKDFEQIEKYVLPAVYNHIQYPPIAVANGISGNVIAEIQLHKDGNVTVELLKSGHEIFNQTAIDAVNESYKVFQSLTKEIVLPFSFYVPFLFEYEKDSYKTDLKNNKAITIKGKGKTNQIVIVRE